MLKVQLLPCLFFSFQLFPLWCCVSMSEVRGCPLCSLAVFCCFLISLHSCVPRWCLSGVPAEEQTGVSAGSSFLCDFSHQSPPGRAPAGSSLEGEARPMGVPPRANSSLLHPQWTVLPACIFPTAFLSLAIQHGMSVACFGLF